MDSHRTVGRVADWPAISLRLPPDLRSRIEAAAGANGRSLGMECVVRIRESLDNQLLDAARYRAPGESAAHRPEAALTNDLQRQLLALFDALTPDRQLALLTLLKR